MEKDIREKITIEPEPAKNTIGSELSSIEGLLQDTIKTAHQLGSQLYPVMESTDGSEADNESEVKLPDKYLKRIQSIKSDIVYLRNYIAELKVSLVI